MQYGTLVNGIPVPAPNPLHAGGRTIYNPPGEVYAAAGYKPVIDTPMPDQPEDGTTVYYTSHWEEQDGKIVRVWTETDPPQPEPVPPTTEERLNALESAMLAMLSMMGGAEDV